MKHKKVLITGASRGIGKAIALQLAKEKKYYLLLHASSQESLEKLSLCLNINCRYELLPCNFNDEAELFEFVRQVKHNHKDLFAIVSNAGITSNKALAFQTHNDINALINVNLKTPIFLSKMAMKLFSRNEEGIFIALGSYVAENGNPFQAVYAATKAANIALCKSLAKEIGQLKPTSNIRFLSISPGFIETDMTQQLNEDIRNKYLKHIPSNRFGKTKEVAKLVAFLIDEKASYINGTNIKIDGGL